MTAPAEPPPLDDVELLPETTGDESARAWGDGGGSFTDDEWLADRPPHHDPR